MNYKPGDDVVVSFDGVESPGVIERVLPSGWVQARIVIDPVVDYGFITPTLAPHSTVCVRDTDIRMAE